MKLSKIAEILNGRYYGRDMDIENLGSLETDYKNEILYVESGRYLEKAKAKNPSALVITRGLDAGGFPYIEIEDPKLAFIKLLEIFTPVQNKAGSGIDAKAKIDSRAEIGKNITIMPGVVIMEGAVIGSNCLIYPNCVIENDCIIGAGTVLYPGVILRERCIVGNDCIIHSGAVIGSDGFGYYKKDDEIIKIPQIGIVKIGDSVEIGANCVIDRATIDKTEIGNYTKLDNLVHIAHNVKIGKKCFILAQTVIGGSVTIGSNVIISGQVAVADHVFIADNTVIMGQSAIHNDIKKADVLIGTPARSMKEHHKIFAALKYLPDLLKRVRFLEDVINKK